MGSHAPSTKVARFTDGDAAQMGAHPEHHQPFWLLCPLLVALWVAQRLPVQGPGLLDLRRRPMANEHGLAPPFDNDVLALWDRGKLDLDLGKRKDVRGRGHGSQELGDRRFRRRGGQDPEGADHEVRQRAVVRGRRRFVRGKVWNLRCILGDGCRVEQTLVVYCRWRR